MTETDLNPAGTLEQRLLDRLELVELVSRYARAVDQCDWPAFGQIFASDADADYSAAARRAGSEEQARLAGPRPRGRAAIVSWLQSARAGGPEQMRFLTNNIVEELAGNRARTWHYVHERHGAYGSYQVEAVRTTGGWRIARLTADVTPPPPATLT